MSKLEEWILSTHIEIDRIPRPYGFFHLTFALTSLLAIIAVCYAARKSSERTFRAVMLGTGAVLLLSEGYKQLYYYYAVEGVGYDWYIFPFQLCSVPMYLSFAIGCMKPGKVRAALCEYLATVGMLGGIMAYAEPSGILQTHYFPLIHSCIWHGLLIFLGLYILFTDHACREPGHYKRALAVLGGVVLTATALNLIFRNKPNFNMCYISPFRDTPLAIFKDIDVLLRGILGQYPGRLLSILLYITAVACGGFILCAVSSRIRHSFQKKGRCT